MNPGAHVRRGLFTSWAAMPISCWQYGTGLVASACVAEFRVVELQSCRWKAWKVLLRQYPSGLQWSLPVLICINSRPLVSAWLGQDVGGSIVGLPNIYCKAERWQGSSLVLAIVMA